MYEVTNASQTRSRTDNGDINATIPGPPDHDNAATNASHRDHTLTMYGPKNSLEVIEAV